MLGVSMPRLLTILYAGCTLSGRTQSLIHIARLPGELPSWDVSICLAGGFDWTWREPARHIRERYVHDAWLAARGDEDHARLRALIATTLESGLLEADGARRLIQLIAA
jgi:hypothetical protein